jgi:carbamoyltransferase
MRNIVGTNRHHNAAVCFLKDGQVDFFIEEERLNRFKHEGVSFEAFLHLRKITDEVNGFALAGFHFDNLNQIDFNYEYNYYLFMVLRLFRESDIGYYNYIQEHHFTHAAGAFYNSNFDRALSIVFDGDGSHQEDGTTESYSCFYFDYDKSTVIDKQYQTREYKENVSLGRCFAKVCRHLGLTWFEAGKVMGLSSYGRDIGLDFNDFLEQGEEWFLYNETKNLKDFQQAANLAYCLQQYTQNQALNKILEAVKKTDIKNICLSGGYILNCVNNYYLKKHLPKDINLYIEPISNDAGTAIGAAKIVYYKETKSKQKFPQKNIYYGVQYSDKEILSKLKKEKTKRANVRDVARLLSQNKMVALFQGRSEAGPRALGIKRREFYRPFAGTVLHEYMDEYFEMEGLEESPFMMYAVNVRKDKVEEIPAITHVDNTCRVQTLKKEFNKNFYDIIKAFYNITDTPILLNTSFNLAGEPMVESITDALNTLHGSKIDYLYLPEYKILVQ